jgi:hypothetical protein
VGFGETFGTGSEGTGEVSENCIMRSFIVCTAHRYHYGDEMKGNEMGEEEWEMQRGLIS